MPAFTLNAFSASSQHSRVSVFEEIAHCVRRFSALGWRLSLDSCDASMTKNRKEASLAAQFLAANAGDSGAYHQFLSAITPIIRTIALQKNHGVVQRNAEDIVQDVLLSIHAKRHTWDQTQPVLPWVYAIMRHRVIDYMRKHGRTGAQHINIDDVSEEQLVDEEQFTERIDLPRHIARLRGRLHTVTKAIGLEGKSIEETSREHGMSENAVRIAFHRALKQLRKGL